MNDIQWRWYCWSSHFIREPVLDFAWKFAFIGLSRKKYSGMKAFEIAQKRVNFIDDIMNVFGMS